MESVDSVGSIPSEKDMLVKAGGGFKKGRAFGMGSESARLRLEYGLTSSAGTSSGVLEDSFRTMEKNLRVEFDKKMEEKVQEFDKKLKKKDRKIEQLMEMNRKVMQHLGIEMSMVAESSDDEDPTHDSSDPLS